MSLKIYMPAVIDDGRLDSILYILKASRERASSKALLTLDFVKTKGISPAGMAILAVMFDCFVEQGNKIKCRHIGKNLRQIPVINNLMNAGKYKSLPDPSIHNFRTSELIFKGGHSSIDIFFTEQMQEIFSDRLSEDLIFSGKLIINELMQNSVDHSTSERYYLYAGLWKGEFHAGVLDMGITIPAKLAQKYTCANDLDFLELAIKKGTGTRRIRTGGFGLYYFSELLRDGKGKMTIISGNAQLRKYFRTRKSQKGASKHFLPGTWCLARFPIEELK